MRIGLAVVALAGSALLAPGLLAPARAQDKESKEVTDVAGRKLDDWIKDITHKDPSKRETAILSVLGFGPEKAYQAVPAMLTELRRHSPEYPIDTSVRVNIAIALGQILPAKKDPDPKVVKDAVNLLTRLLRDSQAIVKYRAAQALGDIGWESRSAIQDLLPLIRDTRNYELRRTGALALGKVAQDRNGPAAHIVAALQGLLKDDAAGVRQAACQALVALGPAADPTQRYLIVKTLDPISRKDSEPSVQVWAHLAIMSYNGKITDYNLEHITQMLHKGDVATRVQAAQALGTVGGLAKETVPALIGALTDPEPNVVGWTVWALGRMESARALAPLEKIAADPKQSDMIKKAAKLSVDQIKKAGASK
jgi:HEAT repeat protein